MSDRSMSDSEVHFADEMHCVTTKADHLCTTEKMCMLDYDVDNR